MTEISSFKDVINLWPSCEAMAADVKASVPAVAKWRQRNKIPSDAWQSIVSTKVAKSKGVTPCKLVKLAARKDLGTRT